MAKQAGPFFITGTIDQICFYRMDGCYYARAKSSLDGKRVKKDPAFRETMRYAELMGKASSISSIVYRALPDKQKVKGLFRKLVAQAMRFLKDNKTAEDIVELLKPNEVRKVTVPGVCKKERTVEKVLFAEKILSGSFGEVSVDIPVLVMHGEDDQIVPISITGAKTVKLLKNGKLISCPGFPHGMPTTDAATINADILVFINS